MINITSNLQLSRKVLVIGKICTSYFAKKQYLCSRFTKQPKGLE